LWTEGRYYIQAEKELYNGWEMRKMERGEKDLKTYIKENITDNCKIGVDLNLYSHENFETLSKFLPKHNLIHDSNNIVDKLWKNKPSYSKETIIIHDLIYAGDSPLDKYKRVKEKINSLVENKEYSLVIVRLDDIAWITNLRGKDIPYNPVFFAFGILNVKESEENLELYLDKHKFNTPEIQAHLKDCKITLYDYDNIYQRLSNRIRMILYLQINLL
jgi:Xaa-Pro aminopeptidase